MKKISVILAALIFCVKIGASQTSKDLDSLIIKFVTEVQLKTQHQAIKIFNTPTDSCISAFEINNIYFYKPATYYLEGYQPDEYFISITKWPNNISQATVLFYDIPGFDCVRLTCFFKKDRVKYVGFMQVPEKGIYQYNYCLDKTGLFHRMKIRSEKYLMPAFGFSKESEEKIAYSDFVNQFSLIMNEINF